MSSLQPGPCTPIHWFISCNVHLPMDAPFPRTDAGNRKQSCEGTIVFNIQRVCWNESILAWCHPWQLNLYREEKEAGLNQRVGTNQVSINGKMVCPQVLQSFTTANSKMAFWATPRILQLNQKWISWNWTKMTVWGYAQGGLLLKDLLCMFSLLNNLN